MKWAQEHTHEIEDTAELSGTPSDATSPSAKAQGLQTAPSAQGTLTAAVARNGLSHHIPHHIPH